MSLWHICAIICYSVASIGTIIKISQQLKCLCSECTYVYTFIFAVLGGVFSKDQHAILIICVLLCIAHWDASSLMYLYWAEIVCAKFIFFCNMFVSSRVDDEDDDFFVDDQEVNRLIIVTQVGFQDIPCSWFCLVICFL
jgi:hypothetical protein